MIRRTNYAFDRNTRAKAKVAKREAKREAKAAAKAEKTRKAPGGDVSDNHSLERHKSDSPDKSDSDA